MTITQHAHQRTNNGAKANSGPDLYISCKYTKFVDSTRYIILEAKTEEMVYIRKWTTDADESRIKPWDKFTSMTYDWTGGLKKFAAKLRADIAESSDPLRAKMLGHVETKLNEAITNGVADWSEAKFKSFRWRCERELIENRDTICADLSINEDAVYEAVKALDAYIDDSVV